MDLTKEIVKISSRLANPLELENSTIVELLYSAICNLEGLEISQSSKSSLNVDSTILRGFLDTISQFFVLLKQENLQVPKEEKIFGLSERKTEIKVEVTNKEKVSTTVNEVCNTSMKSEDLNQSADQMLEISEISSVLGLESEILKEPPKDSMNLFRSYMPAEYLYISREGVSFKFFLNYK